MDTAIDVSRRAGGWSKIVTLGGELLSPGARLRVARCRVAALTWWDARARWTTSRQTSPRCARRSPRRTEETDRYQQALQDLDAARAAMGRQESILASEAATADSALAAAERETMRLTRERQDRIAEARASWRRRTRCARTLSDWLRS